MVEKPGSNKKGEHKSAREKFLSLSLESTRKSYYPQLQKQLEVAKELAEKYRQIVEYAPAGIYEFDMEKMRFISVNDVMCEYTGYTKKEFLELDPSLLFAEESQKKFKELLNEVFAGNQNPEPVEYKIIGKNNRELWVLVNTRFFFENGLPFKATAVVHDLTTIRKAEEEKNRLEAQLQQAQKMEAERLERMVEERTHELEAAQEELVKKERLTVLGQITAIVSHELRNPLGVIRSSAFYLESKLSDIGEKSKKHLKRIEKQVGHCEAIVGELSEFTRERQADVVEGDLHAWLEEVLDQTTIPEQVNLVWELYPGLPMVSFDRDRLQRVMINLFNNAVQAVIERQERFKQEDELYRPQVKVATFMVENGVCIKVEDNGIGMDEKTAGQAFEPLFTTRARGTGLGLAIVKKIVEEHGGSVSLKSEPYRGTKVTVVVPYDRN